jgi:hypothetical protein
MNSETLYSPESQHAVLGAAILDNALLRGPLAHLSVSDFFGRLDQDIFRTMLQLSEDGHSFDAVVLSEALKPTGHFQNGDGAIYIDGLTDGVIPLADRVEWHAKRVIKQAQLRRLNQLCETFHRESRQLTANPARLIEIFVARVAEIGITPMIDSPKSDGLICLADVEPRGVHWLWEGRIPMGTVTIFDGDPGLGKSTLALDLAARLTTCSSMPDGTPAGVTGAVIFLTSEDVLEYTIRPRLDEAGADTSKVFSFDTDADVAPLTLPHDIARLEVMILARGAKLVILDPLVAYLGQDINSHRDQDVRRALAPLQKMAERIGVAIIGIRHLNKTQGSSAIYRGGGSIAIIGAARAGFLVGLDPDDPETRVFAPTKCNLARMPTSLQFTVIEVAKTLATGEQITISKIAWRGRSERSASDLLAAQATDEDKSAQDDAVDFLHETLWDVPKPTKQVQLEAKIRGLSWRTINRAKQKAGVESQKSGFNGEWTMRLVSPRMPEGVEECQQKTMPPFSKVGILGQSERSVTDGREGE